MAKSINSGRWLIGYIHMMIIRVCQHTHTKRRKSENIRARFPSEKQTDIPIRPLDQAQRDKLHQTDLKSFHRVCAISASHMVRQREHTVLFHEAIDNRALRYVALRKFRQTEPFLLIG